MDFLELEAVKGLQWSWNTWPVSKLEATAELPTELFPTYSIVEYAPGNKIMSPKANNGSNINLNRTWGNGLSYSSKSLSSVVSSSSLVSSFSSSSLLAAAGGGGDSREIGPAFVFVVDISSSSKELQSLKK
ncbi:hypothetical protein K1719_016564 [Acacia pycnantha]|nr:hypothetical protein K1719_016564 [Acacia pycnantha]